VAGSISNSDTPSYHGCLRVPCRPFTHWPSEGITVRSTVTVWDVGVSEAFPSFFFLLSQRALLFVLLTFS